MEVERLREEKVMERRMGESGEVVMGKRGREGRRGETGEGEGRGRGKSRERRERWAW